MQIPTQTDRQIEAVPPLEDIERILARSGQRSSGSGKRVAFYSHDTLGLGHLRRTLKIARSVTRMFPEISALVISGSPDVRLVTSEAGSTSANKSGIDVVKLPSVKKLDDEKYGARFLPDDIERIVAVRSEIIAGVIKTFEPHLLLVDHAPVGMRGELLPAFNWLNQKRGSTELVYGMRDIIDTPERIRSRWRRENIFETLENTYDHVFIYGDPRLTPSAELYALPERVLLKTQYCGYISDKNFHERAPQSTGTSARKRVVVTIGGGDYYGPEIIGAFLNMLSQHKPRIDFDSVVITGPLLEPELFKRYKKLAEELPVELHRSVEKIPDLLRSSDALITTAGYNSAVDALSYANRALMAPRVSMREEQVLRVKALHEIGAVEELDPHNASSEQWFKLVTELLQRVDAPLAQLREEGRIDLDGSIRAASFCGEILDLIK